MTFILAVPENFFLKLMPRQPAKCRFVHPDPLALYSTNQFEQRFLSSLEIVYSFGEWKHRAYYQPHLSSGVSVLSLLPLLSSLLQLSDLFRKSQVHRDFMSVRVRNLAPSNSILAIVDTYFRPGKRSFSRAKQYVRSWLTEICEPFPTESLLFMQNKLP